MMRNKAKSDEVDWEGVRILSDRTGDEMTPGNEYGGTGMNNEEENKSIWSWIRAYATKGARHSPIVT